MIRRVLPTVRARHGRSLSYVHAVEKNRRNLPSHLPLLSISFAIAIIINTIDRSSPPESIEALVRVADEGQAHLRHMLLAQRIDLRAIGCRMIRLVDFVGWEVGDVDVGVEAGFERRADLAKAVPGDAAEEFVAFNFGCAG